MKKKQLSTSWSIKMLIVAALITMLLASCGTQRGGCYMSKGYTGYGH
jgi:predicted small secreted protein